ncbi:Ras-related protein RabJ [Operophtera brumata]|uniref:Ras-related protein RabJ n=1 Tax=Operophtera brumata TaxID=104452 RepID=A0A0L7L2H0_OPEBR|nr:Ras-related protein RabJ [Operophtera brumata]
MSADSGYDVYGMPQDKGCFASNRPWVESKCFWHVRSDTAVSGSAAKATLTVAGLGACEAECIRAQGFDPPTIGDEDIHNCILTSSPTTRLSRTDTAGHELYARGNYGRGCEPAVYDDTQNGECYLQYDKAAKLTGAAVRGQARVKDEQTCGTACTEAPFRCLSFSFNNNAPPSTDNCLLSDIRLFDLQKGVDYVHSVDDWLFAFDLFNSRCWRKVHAEDHSSELPHPIIPSSGEEHFHGGPSGPSGPSDIPYILDSGPPSGPSGPSGPTGPYKPFSKPEPYRPTYETNGPSSPEKIYPIEPYRPSRPFISSKPDHRPNFRPDPEIYTPGFRPPDSNNPNFRPPEVIIPYKPEYPDPEPYRPGFGPQTEPRPGYRPEPRPGYNLEPRPGYNPEPRPGFRPDPPSYRPEPDRPFRPTEIYPKPDPGFKPGVRPGDRPGLNRPGVTTQCPGSPVAPGRRSWDYCCAPTHRCGYSEGFHKPWCYVGHKDDQWRPCSEKYYPYHHHSEPHPSQGHRAVSPPPPDYTPHWDKPPGPYLSEADRKYWDDLGPPPNMTYFRYNETKHTTPDRHHTTTTPPSRDLPESRDDDDDASRDEKKINDSKTDNAFSTNIDKTTAKSITTETPLEKLNNSDVELVKPEDFQTIDSLKGIDDKLDDFSKSIEVLDIEDAKGEKLSDLKTLEAEERQIEAIGRLLASRRGTKIVLEKRSQKDLDTQSIAVDKDIIDFNFGNRFPTTERRGVIKRISKDEIERDRVDKSLEVSETTFVRPPRVLSTTENIRKAIVNGKVFYDATIREQRDLFSNNTRKPKNLRRTDNTTPSVINNNNFGRKKIIRTRNANPVRRVKRLYRKRYNPGEVRRRLLERDRSKNNTESSRSR